MLKKLLIKLNQESKNIIFNILFAIFTLFIVIIFYKNIFVTTILLLILAFLGLIRWKSKITLIMFLIGGFFGGFAEIIAINNGVWSYAITDFINAPLWLFVVWGNAVAFIYQSGLELKRLGIKK